MESRSGARSRFFGKKIHFIGIGGSGMSGLARMLLDCGASVSGSEPNPNQQTFDLRRRGVRISRTQSGEMLDRDLDLVVRTAAIPESNGEFIRARELHLPQLKYAELLGQVMAERLGVGVAGTHGKSTTTGMIAHALISCGADPSFVLGGTSKQLGGGSRSGNGPVFVAEACEFDRSFHNLRPTVACITNIDADHLDCYKNIEEIIESFHEFSRLMPADGLILANGDDANVRLALQDIDAPVHTVAVDQPARWCTKSRGEMNGCFGGTVCYDGMPIATLQLSIAGIHNLFNATLALATCVTCGLEPNAAAEAIGQFAGVDRRMTEVGSVNGATVVDDYGHHPTEIRATLAALRGKYKPRRLLCVFQPHQASRTRLLFDDFAASFDDADEAILADIYHVRDSEAERLSVSSADLAAQMQKLGKHARHLAKFEQITEYLRGEIQPGDLIVTMGAGSVWEVGRKLIDTSDSAKP